MPAIRAPRTVYIAGIQIEGERKREGEGGKRTEKRAHTETRSIYLSVDCERELRSSRFYISSFLSFSPPPLFSRSFSLIRHYLSWPLFVSLSLSLYLLFLSFIFYFHPLGGMSTVARVLYFTPSMRKISRRVAPLYFRCKN